MDNIFSFNFKKGMTFVELLVAMAIFSLGMLGVVLLFSSAWKTNSYILEEGNAVAAASRGINEIIKDLRTIRQADNGSYAIKSVGDFDLVVYLDDDNDMKSERVHYFLEGNNFKKGITKSTGNQNEYPNEDQTIEIISPYVMNTAQQPIFTYYNDLFPEDEENNPLVNPYPSQVHLIAVNLWINIKPETAPDNINLKSFAELRNLNEKN